MVLHELKKSRPAPFDPESNGSTDTFPPSGSTTQSSSQDTLAVTSEPVSTHCYHDDDFNITQEVDKCDLWKNMVKKLDAPLPSPRGSYEGVTPLIRPQERYVPVHGCI